MTLETETSGVLMTFSAMYFTGFLVSFHINRIASSEQRATVLSFKGLAYNISYGVLGILYALILKVNRAGAGLENAEDLLFIKTFFWFPMTFIFCFIALTGLYHVYLKSGPQASKP